MFCTSAITSPSDIVIQLNLRARNTSSIELKKLTFTNLYMNVTQSKHLFNANPAMRNMVGYCPFKESGPHAITEIHFLKITLSLRKSNQIM